MQSGDQEVPTATENNDSDDDEEAADMEEFEESGLLDEQDQVCDIEPDDQANFIAAFDR